MIEKRFFINREDSRKVEEEIKYEFLRHTLLTIGLPVEDLLPQSFNQFTVDLKIKLREILFKFEVFLKENGRELEIWVGPELVAYWKTPRFILKTNFGEINPHKRIYMEMIVNYESVFEGE